METIILTDNMRLSTDYYADKTLFAQKIDVNHILNTEVYQSHISRARFWTIRTNIYNEQNLVHELCKNLVNRGSNTINFEFSINKIAIGQQVAYNDQKRNIPINERYNRSSRVSAYCLPNPVKTISFPHFMNIIKPSTHTKTTSSLEWAHHNDLLQDQQRKANEKQAISTPKNKDDEIITLKPLFKKEFEVSSLNELSAVFMSKQGIFSEFGMSQEIVMKSKRMITTYIFRQSDIEIGLSVVSQGCKKYIQKAINIEISQAFNIQFNSRKQAYQSTCLTQNFSSSSVPKSTTIIAHEIQKQTYHKILLFLFSHYDPETQKTKVSSSNLSQPNGNKETSKSIQAIQEWKMKDQDINIAQKLSKQYVLIKQQVENEKVSFKNKLKVFEAIIGQSVNVDKLLNQEKEMENNNNSPNSNKTAQNQQNNLQISANPPQNSRISRKSQLKSMLNSPQQMGASTNSEFKRLKESFEMIRNIDNIINEQNKKIQTLKLYQKQVIKSKNQMLYKSAKGLNQVKKQIQEIKDEIQQKKQQNQFKIKKLQQEKNGKKRNFIPTPEAQNLLHSNVMIFKQIIQNEESNKNNEKYLIDDDITNSKVGTGKQNLQRLSHNSNKVQLDTKKSFFIRKQAISVSHYKINSSMQHTSQQSVHKQPFKQQTNPPTILSTLYQCQQQKQTKLMKKRREQVENNNIWHNVQQQQNRKSYYEEKSQEMSNIKEKQVLLMLYDYFLKNTQLIREANNQVDSYHTLNNPRMNMTLQTSFNNSQVSGANFRTANHNQRSLHSSTSQLNLRKHLTQLKNNSTMNRSNKESFPFTSPSIDLSNFPLLHKILHPKMSEQALQSEQCSIISDTISDKKICTGNALLGEKKQKRVTLSNLVQNK